MTGTTCYFCLDDASSSIGPIVRECSCRGDAAGAHLACIITYATQKSKLAATLDLAAFTMPWNECINCKQCYQGQLSLDLSSAFYIFAGEAYGSPGNSAWDQMRVIDALRSKMSTLYDFLSWENLLFDVDSCPHLMKVECKALSEKLSTMVNQTKTDLKMTRWVHMPKNSFEYQYYKMLVGSIEVQGLSILGRLMCTDYTEASSKIGLVHFVKARTINKLFGNEDAAKEMDKVITRVKSNWTVVRGEGLDSATIATLDHDRFSYERDIELYGLNSAPAVRSGLTLVEVILEIGPMGTKRIQAERIITNLIPICCRIYGPDHNCTSKAEELLHRCKLRHVLAMHESKLKTFQALKYNNEDELIFMGPITSPRQVCEEKGFLAETYDVVLPLIGCPVICHESVSLPHLNGKVGGVIAHNFDSESDGLFGLLLEVQFEDDSLESIVLHPKNVRIAFELPII